MNRQNTQPTQGMRDTPITVQRPMTAMPEEMTM
jgi:hypothetical protein